MIYKLGSRYLHFVQQKTKWINEQINLYFVDSGVRSDIVMQMRTDKTQPKTSTIVSNLSYSFVFGISNRKIAFNPFRWFVLLKSLYGWVQALNKFISNDVLCKKPRLHLFEFWLNLVIKWEQFEFLLSAPASQSDNNCWYAAYFKIFRSHGCLCSMELHQKREREKYRERASLSRALYFTLISASDKWSKWMNILSKPYNTARASVFFPSFSLSLFSIWLFLFVRF